MAWQIGMGDWHAWAAWLCLVPAHQQVEEELATCVFAAASLAFHFSILPIWALQLPIVHI